MLYNANIMSEKITSKRKVYLVAPIVGAVLVSGCANNGNNRPDASVMEHGTVSGTIPEGVNLRYSAGNNDDLEDGSSNRCGVAEKAIDLHNVAALTVSDVDGNGTWIAVPQTVVGQCDNDKDGLVWFSQNVAAVTIHPADISIQMNK